MVMREEYVVDRKIGEKRYRIENVPPGQQDDRVSAKISCSLDGWSYEGAPNPRRVDLCLVCYLVQKKRLSSVQLRWCANIGLNFGLKGPEIFGLEGDYEAASEEMVTTLHRRMKRLAEELTKSADRMVMNMARRSTREDDVRVFTWIAVAPSNAGLFGGVQDALSSVRNAAHELNPFHQNDDDD